MHNDASFTWIIGLLVIHELHQIWANGRGGFIGPSGRSDAVCQTKKFAFLAFQGTAGPELSICIAVEMRMKCIKPPDWFCTFPWMGA